LSDGAAAADPEPLPSKDIRRSIVHEEFKRLDEIEVNAAQEGRDVASGKSERELQTEAKEAEHRHDLRFKANLEEIQIYLLWIAFILFCLALVAWTLNAAHVIVLDDAILKRMEGFLLGVVATLIGSDRFRSRLK
jgi:hypothetical protein